MIPTVQSHFNELIRRHPPPGVRVLELGANAESARGFASALNGVQYVAIALDPTDEDRAHGVVEGDANSMPQFADGSFDAVITSSMLEHNPRFWDAVAEARRVLTPGGRFYVGVPGYAGRIGTAARYARAVRNRLNRAGLHRAAAVADLAVATRTYPAHMEPDDFFRFSPHGVVRVLMAGFRPIALQTVLSPPRIQAVGERI